MGTASNSENSTRQDEPGLMAGTQHSGRRIPSSAPIKTKKVVKIILIDIKFEDIITLLITGHKNFYFAWRHYSVNKKKKVYTVYRIVGGEKKILTEKKN